MTTGLCTTVDFHIVDVQTVDLYVPSLDLQEHVQNKQSTDDSINLFTNFYQ